jgi:hypothetical protein
MDNSPIFKKFYREWVEKLRAAWEAEQLRGIEQMRKAQTERRVIILAVLLILGGILLTSALLNSFPNGTYCEYPDPYGR